MVALAAPQRLDDSPCGKIAGADIADLAVTHELIECAHRLLDRNIVRGVVNLQDVDVVRLQAPQAELALTHDIVAAVADFVRPRLGLGGEADLGGHEHAVAQLQPLEHRTENGLARAPSVADGGIEEVYAGVSRGCDDAFRLRLVGAPAEHHASDADGADPEPGATEIPELHEQSP